MGRVPFYCSLLLRGSWYCESWDVLLKIDIGLSVAFRGSFGRNMEWFCSLSIRYKCWRLLSALRGREKKGSNSHRCSSSLRMPIKRFELMGCSGGLPKIRFFNCFRD